MGQRKRNTRKIITYELVRELLDYNPETGILTWKSRSWGHAKHNGWNVKWAGKEASAETASRYRTISILGIVCQAHVIIFLWMTRRYPRGRREIDHKNRDPSDNRWENLREVTHTQNMRNKAKKGKAGVCYIGRGV